MSIEARNASRLAARQAHIAKLREFIAECEARLKAARAARGTPAGAPDLIAKLEAEEKRLAGELKGAHESYAARPI